MWRDQRESGERERKGWVIAVFHLFRFFEFFGLGDLEFILHMWPAFEGGDVWRAYIRAYIWAYIRAYISSVR